MRASIFLIALWIATLSGAQTISKEDANRFEAYFFDSIAIGVDFPLVSNIYQTLLDVQHSEAGYYSSPYSWHTPNYSIDTRQTIEIRDKERACSNINLMYKRLHTPGYDMEADKQRAKQLIKQFRTEATVLPTFYQLIDKKYKGDVDRYVDNLFDNSFMGNEKVLNKLMKRPTLKKLRKDPAVLYTISKMQYLTLIKLGELAQKE